MNAHDEGRETVYRMQKSGTGAGVGWFSCVPEEPVDLEQGLALLQASPRDRFMHQHVLERLAEQEPGTLAALIERGKAGEPHVLTLAYEACMISERFQGLMERFQDVEVPELTRFSPTIRIPWSLEKASEGRLFWLQQFSHNSIRHVPLLPPSESAHPVPVLESEIEAWRRGVVPIQSMPFADTLLDRGSPPGPGKPDRREATALQRKLEALGILEGWETRTEATLSPFAVERPWRLDVRTHHGRNRCRLTGAQVSYGRGLNIHQARMSCLMEVAERYAAFASVEQDRLPGYTENPRLITGTARDLEARGLRVLDLERVRLEVPYRGDPLGWVWAEEKSAQGSRPVLVPAQLAFLFTNLDEAGLTSGLSSTGLGAGATSEEARLSALLEVIERDAERVVPFSPDRVFVLEADEPRVQGMLSDLERKGIHIRFADLTSEFGVPCFQAFVEGPGGVILKGSGANLDGRRAAVSAMTEIPWPYPYWFGTALSQEEIQRVSFEDLPCWSTGDAARDLAHLEDLLTANGYSPVYVDLTREDTAIPVCRALVPGLEMMTAFDRFTPLGLRQFAHYLDLFS
jgi:ribosomal protein S12 methylthiotransferase accessory factor YcaO